MKKQVLPLLLTPLMLFSCHNNVTDMPKSPFNDSYQRIGMKGEYLVNLTSLPAEEYAKLKAGIVNYVDDGVDKGVTKVVRHEETRDLRYAYFGKEVGTVSFCSMLSRTDTESKYLKNEKNYVTTKEAISNQQNQTANGGIIKNNSTTVDYIYDVNYVNSETAQGTNYGVRTSVKNNDEALVVSQKTPETTTYDEEQFNLLPYKNEIQEHFKPTETYDFKILGDNNSAVYGTCNIDGEERYLIKEGYSVFSPYTTTVGRTYKAVDNYFYEGLLEKKGESFRFTSFRFYHELLILSKAYDEGVPVLYLEKPMTVEYSEVKYQISYNGLGEYTGVIPEVTKE